jgi:RNA polymerase subunit RPABC4/transcription elongation factor Spt4
MEQDATMKSCPYCKGQIQSESLVCLYCGLNFQTTQSVTQAVCMTHPKED